MKHVHVTLIRNFHDRKAAFNQKTIFISKLDLNIKKKVLKRYIWSVVFYGAPNWAHWKVDQKSLENFKCGAGEGWISFGPNV
jgi:hypothetical protein